MNVPYNVTYDANLETKTYAAGASDNTGFKLNWAEDFKIETTIKVTELGKRYLVIGNFNTTDTAALNIEINTNNNLRVFLGPSGSSKDKCSTATITANEDVKVTFIWNASTSTYTATAKGTSTNITLTGTYTMSGTSANGLKVGAADYRTGTSPYSSITVKGATMTKQYTYGSVYGTLPNPTRTGYIFKGWNGKNLLNYNNVLSSAQNEGIYADANGNIIDSTPTSDIRTWNYANSNWQLTLEPGTYTLSLNFSQQSTPIYSQLAIIKENGSVISGNTVNKLSGVDYKTVTFTLTETTNIGILAKGCDGVYKIQLEKGSTATAWEPYYVTSSTKITQAKDHTLTAIYTTDYNYEELNGATHVAYYDTLVEATAGATSGNTIKVLNTLTDTSTENSTVASGKTLTLDLNGKTVTFDRTGMWIENNGTLTVTDTTNGTAGKLKSLQSRAITNYGTLNATGNAEINSEGSGATTIVNLETFVLDGATITSTNYNAVLNYQRTSAKTTINSGTIIAKIRAVENRSGTGNTTSNPAVEINGGTIQSTGTGTAVLNTTSGKIIINNGATITSNTEVCIANNSTGTIDINGGTITATNSEVIYNGSTGTVTISGGTITGASGKTAINNANTGIITISDGVISTTNSDAVQNSTAGTITMSGGTVSTTGSGAGIATQRGQITVTGGKITGAAYGIWMSENSPTVTIGDNSEAVRSTSPIITATGANGNGICMSSGTLNFYDGIIIGKTNYSIIVTSGTINYPSSSHTKIVTDRGDGTEAATIGWKINASDTLLINDSTEYSKVSTIPSTSFETIKQYTLSAPFTAGEVYQLDVDVKGSTNIVNYFYGQSDYLKVGSWQSLTTGLVGTSGDGNNRINLTDEWTH